MNKIGKKSDSTIVEKTEGCLKTKYKLFEQPSFLNKRLMEKTFLIIWIFLLLTGGALAQLKKGQIDLSKVPVPRSHYQPEYTYDVSVDSVSWTKQKSGLHVAFGSTDELYLLREVPSVGQESIIWKETGWKAADADNHYEMFPIPQNARNANPNLAQNPGYTQ